MQSYIYQQNYSVLTDWQSISTPPPPPKKKELSPSPYFSPGSTCRVINQIWKIDGRWPTKVVSYNYATAIV